MTPTFIAAIAIMTISYALGFALGYLAATPTRKDPTP